MNDQTIMDRLVDWACKKTRIYPTEFTCSYYKSCDVSVNGDLWGGNGCQMSYIGRRYGLPVAGQKFRLVIVGMDHGDPTGDTFEKRRNGIEGHYQHGGKRFNPHYRGLVKTAAAVFGSTGVRCLDMCKKSCHASDAPASSPCVLERVVQPNSVKCTPCNTNSRRSRATRQMKANCVRHLASELQVLKPNLVVFHEAGARQFVKPGFEAYGFDMQPIEAAPRDRYGPVLYRSEALGAHILFLYHPTYGWLERQWGTVVAPALGYLRRGMHIPAYGDVPLEREASAQAGEDRSLDPEAGAAVVGPSSYTHGAPKSESDPTSLLAASNGWSDDLKAQTRDVIEGKGTFITRDGCLCLKHVVSGFGVMAEDDLLRGVLRVADVRTGAETTFASTDELIAAGWALD